MLQAIGGGGGGGGGGTEQGLEASSNAPLLLLLELRVHFPKAPDAAEDLKTVLAGG
jgi:hypothetical protein